ncbi:hypothetical protein [Streptomyces sp. cg40]|uniref:hypothetical protein n=1 Tax=Streptomyces sp. cg40 TaxID=3419764 RepID=UPI003D034152
MTAAVTPLAPRPAERIDRQQATATLVQAEGGVPPPRTDQLDVETRTHVGDLDPHHPTARLPPARAG